MSRVVNALAMAFSMYTVLPIRAKTWDEESRALMLTLFPVVGLIIGFIWYGLALLMRALSFPKLLYAVLLTVYPYMISGYLHLDGFMDCCDAIMSRRPREEKLRILKDSHVGAFAVISLSMLLLLCVAFVYSQPENAAIEALIFIPACSRCVCALCIFNLNPIGHSQFAGGFQAGKKRSYSWALAVLLLLLFVGSYLTGGVGAFFSALFSVLACCSAVYYARRQLGGMSGDVSGYAAVISEAVALAAMIVFI